MKKRAICFILILILGFVYSCSPTVKVTMNYDHAVNFSEYKTFAVYDLKAKEGQINQLNADRVTKAIRNEMLAKGFIESDNPDLKVNAVSILRNKTSAVADANYYKYGGLYRPYGYWSSETTIQTSTDSYYTYGYADGSLIIDIVAAKTQKLIWEGIGNAEIDNKTENPEKFINTSIQSILADFPPGAVKK